jgi:glycosyltransferase involved in cell wall biosynthesis
MAMKMRHIVILLPGIDRIGGVERQALIAALSLKQRGWRVSLVTLTGTGSDAAAQLRASGIDFFSLSMRKGVLDPRGWLQFRGWLRENRPDVLHAHLPHASWMARGSRILASVPLQLDTLHTPATGSSLQQWAYRLTSSIPDCVTAVTQGVADTYIASNLLQQDRLFVIPNGLDTNAWVPDASVRRKVRQQLGIGDEFLWVTTGRLEQVKDHATLLRAFASLQTNAHLALLGDGSLAALLKRAAEKLGISPRTHFAGFVEDPRPWLQAADGFVLSSRMEGMPMALLEAASCGLPSVVSDVPGNNEIVTHAVTGILVPPANPDALSAGMTRLMDMYPEERAMMGKEARESAIARYHLDHVIDQWIALYTGLLGDGSQYAARQPH